MMTADRSLSLPGRERAGRHVSREGGQSTVEAAIVMPAMVMLVLGILQLTMVQHARIMTDYAAYCAARAGIVFNADRDAMTRAAQVALLPTMGRTDTLSNVMNASASTLAREIGERLPVQLPVVTVEVLNPKPDDFSGTNSAHLGGSEIDFDDIRTTASRATLLEIRVRYYYNMKIPFVNQMLQTLFFAQKGNAWAVWNKSGLAGQNPVLLSSGEHQVSQSMFVSGGKTLVPEAGKLVMAANTTHKYYFPLQATYTMRMQSNPYLANVGASSGGTP
jgi:hypothetical protein